MGRKITDESSRRRGLSSTKRGKERIEFRLSPEHKALIERAAAFQGETTSGYVISTLVREAQQVIRKHELSTLADRDRDRFLELLANPPEPTEALRRATRRHQELISSSK